ncbi:MAG: hypothetical protein ORN49_09320 [Rhodobacteraceae bacterium]|nr:hypothetical protein [Paracoccaceae bacterium]
MIATGNVQAQDSATGQPRKTWASMMLAGGGVTVAGPSGYCVDPSASHEGKKGAFVLLGSCASLAGSSDRASPQTAAILTATTSPSGAGEATLSGFFPTMARFLQSDAGRKALSRSGQARTVTIQKIASVEDVMYVSVRDTARAPGQDVETDYWRALFSLNGQIVTLSVLSLKTMPLDQTAKRALLERFVARVKSASQS